MRITLQSPAVYLNYLTKQLYDYLCTDYRSKFDYYTITIAELSEIINNTLPIRLEILSKLSILNYLDMTIGLNKFLENYFNYIFKELSLPNDPTYSKYTVSLDMNTIERLLIFIRLYFGHKDFGESENITLAELCLAKKDLYERDMSSYKLNKSIK